jgi:putative MATE family efflux protein
MVYNIVANLVNILGNWLLIYGNLGFPEMGVAGASLATVIGQAVGTVMAFGSVISGKYYLKLKLNLKNLLKFDRDVVSGMAKVGVPAMIEQLIMRVGLVIYSRTVSTLGEISLATYQICLNIQSLTMMNGQAFAVSATALIGQSLGKLRIDMAEHYGKRCRQLALYISLLLAVIFIVFREQLVMLYNKDPIIVSTGGIVMLIVAFMQPIQSSQFVLGGILRGAGDTKVTAVYVFITTVILRTTLGYLLVTVLGYGLIGAWIAIAADQILRTFLFIFRYNQGKWKRIKL